jgi:hypothetical protein
MEDIALFVLPSTDEEEETGGSKASVQVVKLKSKGETSDTESEASSLGFSEAGSHGQTAAEFAKILTSEEVGYASKFSSWSTTGDPGLIATNIIQHGNQFGGIRSVYDNGTLNNIGIVTASLNAEDQKSASTIRTKSPSEEDGRAESEVSYAAGVGHKAKDSDGPMAQRQSLQGYSDWVTAVLEKLSDAARAILEVSSFLDPDCIQEKLLTTHATNVDIPSYPKNVGAFCMARGQLIGSYLFRHNQEKGEYSMHRLTRHDVRAQIESERKRKVFSNVVTMVAAAWPVQEVDGHDVTLWNTSKALYPHVLSLEDAYKKYFKQKEYLDGDFQFAELLNRAGW